MGDGCKLTIDGDLPIETKRQIFGGFLRAAREGREKSLTELVHATRISPNFVMALESGDFEALPGKVFGRGFIKNLCVALDVPPKELIDLYEICWDDEPARYEVPHHSKISKPNGKFLQGLWRRPVVVATLAATTLVASGVWFFLSEEQRKTEQVAEQVLPTPEPEALIPEPDKIKAAEPMEQKKEKLAKLEKVSVEPKVVEKAVIPQEGGVLELTVLEDVTVRWVSDDQEPLEKLLKAGSETFSFKETLSVIVNETEKVKIRFQGKELGSLGSGERKFTFSAVSQPVYAVKKI